MQRIQEWDAEMLRDALERDAQGVRVIDVRTPDEVARVGTIPGAAHLPLAALPLRAGEIDDNATIVVYCHSGARSAQACAFLLARGRRNVYNLRGGIIGWAGRGFPVVPKVA